MALIDRVQERVSSSLLEALTNPDEPETSSVDTTYLQRVCDDVEVGEFVAWMNESYDEAIRLHILAAIALVRLKLIEFGAAPGSAEEKLVARLEKTVERYRHIRARDRIAPQSSSELTPSVEVEQGETIRPAFDDRYFEDMTPEAPPFRTELD